ncbi:MAG: serine hydrolase [Clostridia bacterium]|nr:serine hydrolase [Clostridia bacterium]
MFEKITPEQAGLKTQVVTELISLLNRRGAATHGILLMRHGKILAEHYWAPFHKDFCHRMYSQTKSFVGVALGLLEEEGKLNLDEKIVNLFPEKIHGELHEYLKNQTVREMMTMTTAGVPSSWFRAKAHDRTEFYFSDERYMRPSGTFFDYDSAGSQVLCALVEKLAGMPLLDYMKEKLFNRMGAFQTATVLKTPNGDSWGDSAMICTLRDMAAFGQLVMNYGTWEGERLMNEKFLRTATSKLVDNNSSAHYSIYNQGYGYQIWRIANNGFAFVGMGDQITLCFPDKDLIFAIMSDNQGTQLIRHIMMGYVCDEIAGKISDKPLPEDPKAQAELEELSKTLKLRSVQGQEDSPFRAELDGKTYICNENTAGITKFSFHFKDAKSGEFHYTNAQGDKVLPFGVNHNVFGKFPQLGYSNDYGVLPTTDGFMYDDAVSLAWYEDKKIMMLVQIIDRYFGNMSLMFSFKGNEVSGRITKTAEDFLNEYPTVFVAKRQD